jgi:hypothetical protein
MTISYAITVCNERQEISVLINTLIEFIQPQDEIVILYDSKNGDPKVWEYLNLVALTDDNQFKGVSINEGEFNGNFAEWKNKLNSLCKGDYIFNIDADEIPQQHLIQSLPAILENPDIDLLYVPRVNTVGGITQEHINKWGWKMDEMGWINFPDYQTRIYKNSPEIKWEGKVHETVKGFKSYGVLPKKEEFSLYHPKTIERQEKQNNYYDTL